MKLFILAIAFRLALSHPGTAEPDRTHHTFHAPHDDRCSILEFDAVTVNDEGELYFFKDDKLYKGFYAEAELSNKTFIELDDQHHIGHVDAAFHMQHSQDHQDKHSKHDEHGEHGEHDEHGKHGEHGKHDEHGKHGHHDQHDHQFFFLDNKVFSYDEHKLEKGYPKDISEVFPGIPDHLDAAVECPKPDCPSDSVLFFKGQKIYHYDIKTKKVDETELKSMPNCTSAFRYMGHYYCLHGHHFSMFDPINVEVHGKYPKDIRGYFIRCHHFDDNTVDEHIERERCSRVHLDSITEEEDGDLFAFRDHHFLSVINHTFHSDKIQIVFKGLHSDVDAAYSHEGHIHVIKGDMVYAHKVSHTPGDTFEPLDGYPVPLKEELGIESPVDAAFICPGKDIVYVIKGKELYEVDLKVKPPVPGKPKPFTTFKKIDTAMCGTKGVTVMIGSHFYHFGSPMLMLASKAIPVKHDVAKELFGCDHYIPPKQRRASSMSEMLLRKPSAIDGMSSSLSTNYEDKVHPCIDLVDSLRSLGVEKDLNLSAIASIGISQRKKEPQFLQNLRKSGKNSRFPALPEATAGSHGGKSTSRFLVEGQRYSQTVFPSLVREPGHKSSAQVMGVKDAHTPTAPPVSGKAALHTTAPSKPKCPKSGTTQHVLHKHVREVPTKVEVGNEDRMSCGPKLADSLLIRRAVLNKAGSRAVGSTPTHPSQMPQISQDRVPLVCQAEGKPKREDKCQAGKARDWSPRDNGTHVVKVINPDMQSHAPLRSTAFKAHRGTKALRFP
ncbi:hypothetical protein P4O66_000847 [Electrophorus voltai]|uniref:Hemopexin n=1 Tax=Electrophorus voltai TaxID=2609070 RepID=A0AAD9DYE2_9TELE|nr:hypothetical protein P4O66_000847 [Electrophorus voltai]